MHTIAQFKVHMCLSKQSKIHENKERKEGIHDDFELNPDTSSHVGDGER